MAANTPAKPHKKPTAEARQAEPAQSRPPRPRPQPSARAWTTPPPQEAPGKAPTPAAPTEAQPEVAPGQAKPGEAPAQQQGEQVAWPAGTSRSARRSGRPAAGRSATRCPDRAADSGLEKVTPQELERRKETAAGPSKSIETVFLPGAERCGRSRQRQGCGSFRRRAVSP